MKVLFMTNIPSPYRVDFFNKLGSQCELTVLFEARSAKSRNENWKAEECGNFKSIFLNGIAIGDAEGFCPEVLKYLSLKKYDVIVVGFYASPTAMLAIEYMRLKNIPFILSSDGGIKKNEEGIKYKIKKHFISAATAWLSTGDITTEYLEYYGAKKDKIYVYPFTSISKREVLDRILSNWEKEEYRKKLGIKEEKVVLSVGQFIYRKGYDLLLNSCNNLDGNVGIYIVGDSPSEEYLQIKKNKKLKNVHFINFLEKHDLKEYYKAADLFILPTREDIWGLVINEAMAHGLPVITTNKCVAGVEMIEGNGKIVKETCDWSKEINDFFKIKNRVVMEEKSLVIAEKYSIEEMVNIHMHIFSQFLK